MLIQAFWRVHLIFYLDIDILYPNLSSDKVHVIMHPVFSLLWVMILVIAGVCAVRESHRDPTVGRWGLVRCVVLLKLVKYRSRWFRNDAVCCCLQ